MWRGVGVGFENKGSGGQDRLKHLYHESRHERSQDLRKLGSEGVEGGRAEAYHCAEQSVEQMAAEWEDRYWVSSERIDTEVLC